MATGSHGIRFQYDYTHDTAGPPGIVTAATPRWLRLVRSGDTIIGYTSANGHRWTEVGSTRLPGLPATVQVGLFVTSPADFSGSTGYPTLATATFDHITVNGAPAATTSWHRPGHRHRRDRFYPTLASGSYHQSGSSVVVTGSGDIAPAVVAGLVTHTASSSLPFGLIVGLLVVIVVAAMFVTVEYRRGLIRTTFTAIPAGDASCSQRTGHRRGLFRLSALGDGHRRSSGSAPAAIPRQLRLFRRHSHRGAHRLGASAVIAMAAIIVIALSAIVRRPAAAIAAGVAVILVPIIVATAAGAVSQPGCCGSRPPPGSRCCKH